MVRCGVAFTPEMQGMADCAVRAATELRDGMPLLGAINRSVDRLNAMSVAVRSRQGTSSSRPKGHPDAGTQSRSSKSMASNDAQRPPQGCEFPPTILFRTDH